jgi:hypothetical protein
MGAVYLLSFAYYEPERMPLRVLGEWPVWCLVAWIAMQGPGQWRASLVGLLAAFAWVGVGLVAWPQLQPFHFGSWHTFWTLDAPITLFPLLKGWALFRILSMISGIEIVDPQRTAGIRWSLRRWFLLMIALAVFLQSTVLEMNWYGAMSEGLVPGTLGDEPAWQAPGVRSRLAWLQINTVVLLEIPFVPILLAGWMLAGRRWRWVFFPVLGGVVVASYALAEWTVDWVRLQERWLKNILPVLKKEWALYGTTDWFAYCAGAILVPWMGYRWCDYWSPLTVQPSPSLPPEASDE